MDIQLISTADLLYTDTLQLRNEVLRLPLGMDIQHDDLSDEPQQLHFVATEHGNVFGVVVLKIEGKVGKLRQMAVSPEAQGKSIGRELVSTLEQKAAALGLTEIKLHARHYAAGFYAKLGYTKTLKSPFEEVGMQHFEMAKKLL